jgi:RHS repeat-associated protein
VTDAVGSVRAAVDPSGQVVATWRYDAFGNLEEASAPGFGLGLGYALGQPDADTGLLRMGHRWYDPSVGRFIEPDPMGYAHGANRYVYVENAPHAFADPLGLWGVEIKLSAGEGGRVSQSVGIGTNANGLQGWGTSKLGVGLDGSAGVDVGAEGVGFKLPGVGVEINFTAKPPLDGKTTYSGDAGLYAEGQVGLGAPELANYYAHGEATRSFHDWDAGPNASADFGFDSPFFNAGVQVDGNGVSPVLKGDTGAIDALNKGGGKLGINGNVEAGVYGTNQLNLSNIGDAIADGASKAWNGIKDWWDCLF